MNDNMLDSWTDPSLNLLVKRAQVSINKNVNCKTSALDLRIA